MMMEAIVDDLEIENERLEWIQVADDMNKLVHNRSETEMSRLMTLMNRMNFFKGMSFNDRLYLARNMSFRKVTAGEVLLVAKESEEQRQLLESHNNLLEASHRTANSSSHREEEDNEGAESRIKSNSFSKSAGEGGDKKENLLLDSNENSTAAPMDEEYIKLVESATFAAKAKEEERKKREAEAERKKLEQGNEFFIIVFGAVGLQQQTTTGRVQTLLEVGETFGNPLIMDALPPGSAYVATTNCEFLVVNTLVFHEKLSYLDTQEVERRIDYFKKQLIVPVFSSMTDAQFEKLARTVYPVSYQSKELVVKEREPADAMYFILRGKMKVVREIDFTQVAGVPQVKLLELATLVEGEYFGELSFLRMNVDSNRKSKLPDLGAEEFLADNDSDDEMEAKQINPMLSSIPRQSTVYTHTPCTLLVLPRLEFISQITDSSLVRLREYAKGYPTQQDIRAHFTKKQRWEGFKEEVMGRVSAQRYQL